MNANEDVISRLERLKEEALERVREAASRGDVDLVSRYTGVAEDCQRALETLKEVEETARAMEVILSTSMPLVSSMSGDRSEGSPDAVGLPGRLSITGPDRSGSSSGAVRAPVRSMMPEEGISASPLRSQWAASRSKGMSTRREWIEKVKRETGIVIEDLGRYRYRSETGLRLGLAFASELTGKPGSWFLGLSDELFDVVVLLCRRFDGTVLDFVVPMEDLLRALEKISLARNGRQRKLNVRKMNGNYYLLLAGNERMSIGKYLGNYEPLKRIEK